MQLSMETVTRDATLSWLRHYAELISLNKPLLTELDSDIGDGDHGANMQRGMQAVLTRLAGVADKDIGSVFKMIGTTLVATVGGAGGPLFGTLFVQMGNATLGKRELTLSDWAAALQAGVEGVMMRGKAQPGEKTMIDALMPALSSLQCDAAGGVSLAHALPHSVEAAAQGKDATAAMVASKGRASYLGERSLGHIDPGATSAYLLLKAMLVVV
jgi:dihydroxyacetone kinase-like protein